MFRARALKAAVQARLPTIIGGQDSDRRIAITFDDGPDPKVTPRILDLLQEYRAKATFFLLSEKATGQPEIVKRISAEGHEVALHFDRHDRIPSIAPWILRKRLLDAKAALEVMAGPIRLFRPPYGSQSVMSYLATRSIGLQVVGWTASAQDWLEQSAEMAAANATSPLGPGDILLLHDGLELRPEEPVPTFDRALMVRIVLDTLIARNLHPTSVGEIISCGAAKTGAWFKA